MKDIGGVDHNKQSLRIVTELEQRYPEFPGPNHSWETREGVVKHESEYDWQMHACTTLNCEAIWKRKFAL